MGEGRLTGVQEAIFGDLSPAELRARLNRHLQNRLGAGVAEVLFERGDVGAVFGLRLDDGREVVLKALRPGADAQRLRAVVRIQNRLARAGYGAARVLDGPSRTTGVLAVVEELLRCPATGSPHDVRSRAAMAAGLGRQIDLLRRVDGSALVAGRPAWANWEAGAWPAPHVPVFDFSTPVPGFEWIDREAQAAAGALSAAAGLDAVVGHSDWVWQNVCVRAGRFVAGYDWDSLVYLPEPAIVGLAAGAFSQGSPEAPDAPSALEVAAFLEDYERARSGPFGRTERRVADAAARWVRCYNARCQLDNLTTRKLAPPAGSFIDQLRGEVYGRGGWTRRAPAP